ncbi:acetoacetyl-CoA synthetase-like protein [Bisporella sp. PMI_857]|nr:acetoacetyl-CoA synthetase-like protein [Bisporella sp. PMI_857]
MTTTPNNGTPRMLWKHPHPQSTAMYKFMQEINSKQNLQLKTYQELHSYSVVNRSKFWDQCLHFLNLIYTGSYTTVVDENARIDSVPRWFEGMYVNIAENLLYSRSSRDASSHRGTTGKEDAKVAVTQVREGNTEVEHLTWGELRAGVGELTSAMRNHGVKKGDRIAIVASNSFDTLKVFLATAALGGIFSSSSTDMGVNGILDRLQQIKPKYVFIDDWAVYNGKKIDLLPKMAELVSKMANVKEFVSMVSMPRFKKPADISGVARTITLQEFNGKSTSREPFFEKTAFRDPFLIGYSSGTTGLPKCIVHSNGGALLSAAKENVLHHQMTPESVILQYTTTGWIMYFFTVLGLLKGARGILYDGSPFQPDITTFIKILEEQQVTYLGTSPRWMAELQKNGIVPRDIADLSKLQIVTSTGMVLSDQQFEWFYDTAFPKHVQLGNMSGGTDIVGCFGILNPLDPLYVGGTQGMSLGIPVEVYDSLIEGGVGIQGKAIGQGTPGELVATTAFPNMPIGFWDDPQNKRYLGAYFTKYDNVWTHGDFVMIHPVTKQLIFLGRADGVLNPSGVRFGSAEIYSVLEQRFHDIADSICVGQRRPTDTDETVILFCLMRPGKKLTKKLVAEIKDAIRKERSPRHVPKYVFETPEIPTTVNLKKVELPVKQIVSGMNITASGTLLNPESLKYYYQFAKIEEVVGPAAKL